MNYDVVVSDHALDNLPQDLPFAALDKFLDLLDNKLAADPVGCGERAPRAAMKRAGSIYHDGFESDGVVYLFFVKYWYRREESLLIYDAWMATEPAE